MSKSQGPNLKPWTRKNKFLSLEVIWITRGNQNQIVRRWHPKSKTGTDKPLLRSRQCICLINLCAKFFSFFLNFMAMMLFFLNIKQSHLEVWAFQVSHAWKRTRGKQVTVMLEFMWNQQQTDLCIQCTVAKPLYKYPCNCKFHYLSNFLVFFLLIVSCYGQECGCTVYFSWWKR